MQFDNNQNIKDDCLQYYPTLILSSKMVMMAITAIPKSIPAFEPISTGQGEQWEKYSISSGT